MRFTEATHCASRTDFVTRAGKKTWPKPRRNWTPPAIPATRNSPPYESHIPHPGGFNAYRHHITCRSSFAHGAGLPSQGPILQDDRTAILETSRKKFLLARRHDRRQIVNCRVCNLQAPLIDGLCHRCTAESCAEMRAALSLIKSEAARCSTEVHEVGHTEFRLTVGMIVAVNNALESNAGQGLASPSEVEQLKAKRNAALATGGQS